MDPTVNSSTSGAASTARERFALPSLLISVVGAAVAIVSLVVAVSQSSSARDEANAAMSALEDDRAARLSANSVFLTSRWGLADDDPLSVRYRPPPEATPRKPDPNLASARPVPPQNLVTREGVVQNYSREPIFDTVIKVTFDPPGDESRVTLTASVGVLSPCMQAAGVWERPDWLSSYPSDEDLDVVVTFRDTQNRSWRRTRSGLPTEIQPPPPAAPGPGGPHSNSSAARQYGVIPRCGV